MNKVFKVIWNSTLNRLIVVSELTKSKGKASSSSDKRVKLSVSRGLINLSAYGSAMVTIGLPHGRMLKEGNLLLSAQIQMQAVLNLLLSGMMFFHQGEVQ